MAASYIQDGNKEVVIKAGDLGDNIDIILTPGISLEAPTKEQSFGKTGGLGFLTTCLFIMGSMAGSGVLALPRAITNSGWIGSIILVLCCMASGYNGRNLGKCWNIIQERYPEYRSHVRYPYPAIGEKAVGKWMRYVISVNIDITLFGVSTVFLLLASQNVQSLLQRVGVDFSFCYLVLLIGACLVPISWLGTPKDFWPVAVGAMGATALACVLLFINIIMDFEAVEDATHNTANFESLFLAFGTILFSFGGAATFPTIQHDMKNPKQFPKAIFVSFSFLLLMYLPVALAGYLVYGDDVKTNILQSITPGPIRSIVEILITCHLVLAFVVVFNPFSQDFEELFRIPVDSTWKRCVLRTIIVGVIVFLAESIPHFGAVLDLIGGSTATFLTFVAPSLFYLRLCSMEGDWPKREIHLHEKVINIEIMLIGLLGGIAATYSAISEIASPETFVTPCYINITLASGRG